MHMKKHRQAGCCKCTSGAETVHVRREEHRCMGRTRLRARPHQHVGPSQDGWTALHVAAPAESAMMVDLILNNRAVDVAAVGKVGSRSHVQLRRALPHATASCCTCENTWTRHASTWLASVVMQSVSRCVSERVAHAAHRTRHGDLSSVLRCAPVAT